MQIRSLKSWFGQNLKTSIFYKFVFASFVDFWAVFQGPEVSKSNAAWKNTPGVLSLDLFARWEARTAPCNSGEIPETSAGRASALPGVVKHLGCYAGDFKPNFWKIDF